MHGMYYVQFYIVQPIGLDCYERYPSHLWEQFFHYFLLQQFKFFLRIPPCPSDWL